MGRGGGGCPRSELTRPCRLTLSRENPDRQQCNGGARLHFGFRPRAVITWTAGCSGRSQLIGNRVGAGLFAFCLLGAWAFAQNPAAAPPQGGAPGNPSQGGGRGAG